MDRTIAEAYASLEAVKRKAQWLETSLAMLRAVVEARPEVVNTNTPGYVKFDQRCKAVLWHIDETGRGL